MEASTPRMDVLDTLRSGRRDTLDRLMPVVYGQFRVITRLTPKREGAPHRVTLDDEQIAGDEQAEVMLDIDDAVDPVASVEPRLARTLLRRALSS